MRKPKPIPALTPKRIERFWSYVATAGTDDCWLWTKTTNARGYGRVMLARHDLAAHRVAYFLGKGEDPGDLLVCHSCDNPPCCNPAHLFAGTSKDNTQDAKAKGRLDCGRGERHGSRTHPERVRRGTKHHGARITEEQAREIRVLFRDGMSWDALAARFGVSQATIGRVVRGKNWAHAGGPISTDNKARCRPTNQKGEGNRSAKLTEENVREIRALRHDLGLSLTELGRRFGVCSDTVSCLLAGRTWTHVT